MLPRTSPKRSVIVCVCHACHPVFFAPRGTSGSLDGQQRLIVKGRFLPKSFETVLRRYVNECVQSLGLAACLPAGMYHRLLAHGVSNMVGCMH